MRRHSFKTNVLCISLYAIICAMSAMQNAIADDAPRLLELVTSNAQRIAPIDNITSHSNHLDALTERALSSIIAGDWTTATKLAQELTQTFPDYALGQLILAEAHTVSGASEPLLSSLPTYEKSLIDLLLEARARVQHAEPATSTLLTPSQHRLPAELVQVGKHTDNVVLVDLDQSRLYLFDTTESQPKLIKKHYVSSGAGGFGKLIEGDLKTPLGIYRINGYRSDESLPALYGSGALMLNYPNILDRSLGRSGSGIWLHGNPTRSRSPRSSEGCVTMANDHLLDLHHQINLARTSVVLTHHVKWVDPIGMAVQRDRFQELFNQYRNAWLNNDIADLTSIYLPSELPSSIRALSVASARKVSSNNARRAPLLSPSGIDLNLLENVRASDITLMLNPTAKHDDQLKHLIMEFELGGSSTAKFTLYWEQNAAGFWQIKREEIDAGSA